MKNRFTNFLEPRFRFCFLILLVFAGITLLFQPIVALCEFLLVIIIYLRFRYIITKRNKETLINIESVLDEVHTSTKDTLIKFPMPITIIKLDTNEIIWYNDQFVELTGAPEHLFETHVADVLPDFDTNWLLEGKSECPHDIKVADRVYHAFGTLSRSNDSKRGLLATVYWVDVTSHSQLLRKYNASRMVTAILLLDNYDELMKGVSDSGRSVLLAQIDSKIGAWADRANGILLKYERNRYLFIFEEQYLKQYCDEKFSVLDEVRKVVSQSGVVATLSIGIGKDGENFFDNYKSAQLSIDMSLSRGGDQAVVRGKFNFEFFGGHAQELEKRTKVKSRVMATALAELMKDASNILVMGHKNTDNDCVGAAMGIMCLARKFGKNAIIVIDLENTSAEAICARVMKEPEYQDVFITAEDAIIEADKNTLLVVVDVNRPQYVESEPLLESVHKIALIDHHRRSADYIQNATFHFHEPYASSTCELVTELMQYLLDSADILPCEAEALLAGIVLDTKNFTMKTGVRTFEAAAMLRRAGADTVAVKRLFQNDLTAYVGRADIVKTAKMYHGNIAIAAYNGTSDRATAAQAADELLNITKVQASFVLYKAYDTIVISARSLGNINVQVILEKLGGGGHLVTAGAQIKDATMEEVLEQLTEAIDSVLENE